MPFSLNKDLLSTRNSTNWTKPAECWAPRSCHWGVDAASSSQFIPNGFTFSVVISTSLIITPKTRANAKNITGSGKAKRKRYLRQGGGGCWVSRLQAFLFSRLWEGPLSPFLSTPRAISSGALRVMASSPTFVTLDSPPRFRPPIAQLTLQKYCKSYKHFRSSGRPVSSLLWHQ